MGRDTPAKAAGTPGQAGRALGQAACRASGLVASRSYARASVLIAARAKGLGKRVQGLLHERTLNPVFLLNSGGLHAIAVGAV
jgi:hypothetical protein